MINSVIQELEMLDSKENHLRTLDNLEHVYLCSQEANDHQERTEIVLLLSILKRIFK